MSRPSAADRLERVLEAHASDPSALEALLQPEDPLPTLTPALVAALAGSLRETHPERGAIQPLGNRTAQVRLSGPGGALVLRCRVSETNEARVEDLTLLPLQPDPVLPWEDLSPAPSTVLAGSFGGATERLLGWLQELREELQLVGVTAALVGREGLRAGVGLGWSDWGSRTPMDPARALLRVGSITKTMTSVAALQLVERGLLDLDAPAAERLTTVRIDRQVTARHLLSHTAALREIPEPELWTPFGAPEEPLVALVGDEVPLAGRPGEAWAYSNVGMALLGQLVEDVVGVPVEKHLESDVLQPAGLRDSSLLVPPSWDAVPTGYAEGANGVRPVERVVVGVRAAGSAFCPLRDLAAWAQTCLAGFAGADVPLLTPSGWRAMAQRQADVPGAGSTMGLGFLQTPVRGNDLLWHNGALPGAASQLWLAPGSGVAVVLSTNVYSPHRGPALDRAVGRLCSELA